ncbi:unnamed protein product [Mytilus edulis]|uniref:Uncharacterized protein n=1 Tax=Mytilus edulis TaxID=6550 RepID=A0A8S3PXW9_MYTED|nr:unnamed protein product [Mytilus edulis]
MKDSDSDIEMEKLKLVKCIVRKFGFDQFDLHAACQHACDSKMFKIVEWFLQNADITLMVSTIWNRIGDKEEFKMDKIVNTAYERKCFELLMWIHCNPIKSIDGMELIVLALADDNRDKKYNNAKWNVLTMIDQSLVWIFCWKSIDHESLDISRIVSTVCQEKEISNNVMTWILLNLPFDKISINAVLIKCCQQKKINHVMYILHKVENDQLDIKEAFVEACRAAPVYMYFKESNISDYIMIVDYLFQMLHDKESSLFLIRNELLFIKSFDLILYFLRTGYCRNIDMNNLLKESGKHGHILLVRWILENIKPAEIDIKAALIEVCNGKKLLDI